MAFASFAALAQAAQRENQDPTRNIRPRTSPTPTQDEEIVERVDVDLTNVLMSVVDKQRQFVTTLTRDDIRVLEDDVPQQVFTFQRETDLPLSIAILIDTSASQEKVIGDEREAATAFIDSVLRPNRDLVAIISFTGITRIEKPLTANRAELARAIEHVKVPYNIDSPECRGGDEIPDDVKLRCVTGVFESIYITVRESLRHTPPSTRRAIILLSDGDDTLRRTPLYKAVEYAIENNTAIYSIGIRDRSFRGGELRKDHLRQVSEETGGRAFFPKNRHELDEAFSLINQELRTQYLVAYSPSNRKRDGTFRRVKVEITNPALRKAKLRLLYRQGYYAQGERANASDSETVRQPRDE
jgi:VWFA-related protein